MTHYGCTSEHHNVFIGDRVKYFWRHLQDDKKGDRSSGEIFIVGNTQEIKKTEAIWIVYGIFLKFIFIILIFHTCGYVNVNAGVHRGQRHWILLELELEAVVSQQMWMLWPSVRVHILKL